MVKLYFNTPEEAVDTISQLFVTFLCISVSVYLLQNVIPFMINMNEPSKIAVSILSGTIFIAKSPSSVVAVINELRAKGRFTQMVISVTVILDVLVIILFTICLTFANNLINQTHISFLFLWSIFLEFVIILIIGFIMIMILK